MTIRISVVIPAFNEERYLPRLLASLDMARRAHSRDPAEIEIIVADNGSTDNTVLIAEAHGCAVVPVVPRVIGAVRNAGARAARGDILAFVDADTRVHPRTFVAIEEYFASRKRVVGTSGVLPERRSRGIDTAWWFLGLLTVLFGYGIPRTRWECVPSGVVCCRREDWAAVGGYSERWLFAEDVLFLLDLRRLGRSRWQSCGWLANAPAVFSTRKFDQFGDWHFVLWPPRFLYLGLFGRARLRAFVESYWYGPQRSSAADAG